MKRLILAPSVLFLFMFLTGCDPSYERVSIVVISNPPVPSNVSGDFVEIQSGIAVMVEVAPLSSNSHAYENSDSVDLRSNNSGVYRVMTGSYKREFALIGVSPGQTQMDVYINGTKQETIDVNILEP